MTRISRDADVKISSVQHIPATQSPFGVDIWDCRAFTHNMVSTTRSAEIASKFARLRSSRGEEYKGRRPREAGTVSCSLTYACPERPLDGPLFKSEQMEDKWDIYLFNDVLYFARSWTGDLLFCASTRFDSDWMRLTCIVVDGDQAPEFALRVVDYLVKSHILGRNALHPLPPELPKVADAIAAYSFSMFGRRCSFGTYADTTTIEVPMAIRT